MSDEAPAGPGAAGAQTGTRAPDRPLTGWRYWRLDPATGLLRSLTMRAVAWRPGQALRASCRTGHRAPSEGCACGIYGAAHLASLHDHGLCLPGGTLVLGQVALWGEVVGDHGGYRGEYGYPSTLSIVAETVPEGRRMDDLVAELSSYRVPVATTTVSEAIGGLSSAIMAFQAMSRP